MVDSADREGLGRWRSHGVAVLGGIGRCDGMDADDGLPHDDCSKGPGDLRRQPVCLYRG